MVCSMKSPTLIRARQLYDFLRRKPTHSMRILCLEVRSGSSTSLLHELRRCLSVNVHWFEVFNLLLRQSQGVLIRYRHSKTNLPSAFALSNYCEQIGCGWFVFWSVNKRGMHSLFIIVMFVKNCLGVFRSDELILRSKMQGLFLYGQCADYWI